MRILKSFGNALRGVRLVFREERSFRLQVVVAILVVILMFVFNITLVEKSILFLLMALVLILEMMNSIMERFVDVLKPRIHTYVKDMKDIAAGAVFISSLGAAAVGIIIFYPHIYDLIKNCSWLRI
jgi:diacylglycerol kinase